MIQHELRSLPFEFASFLFFYYEENHSNFKRLNYYNKINNEKLNFPLNNFIYKLTFSSNIELGKEIGSSFF